MSFKVKCYTLFDITQTGVINRSKPGIEDDVELWLEKRNSQCNFDTILQAISLRSQPEDVTTPKHHTNHISNLPYFGFLYESEKPIDYWMFTFSIHHPSVFYDGISELGSLYSDCDQVPMIKTKKCFDKLQNSLDVSEEMRNIYFEVIDDN